MKRVIILVLALLLWASQAYATDYHITTYAQLQAMSSDLAGTYYLDNDIDCKSEAAWTRVGSVATPFTGSFYGQGHVIFNMHAMYGVWGKTLGAYIEKVGFENILVDSGFTTNTGGMICYAVDTTIDQCFIKGIMTGSNFCGGMISSLQGTSAMTNCYGWIRSAGNGQGNGLVASVQSGTSMTNCYVDGWVSTSDSYSSASTGGLVGQLSSGASVINCFSTAKCSVTKAYGGYPGTLIGDNGSGGTITNCQILNSGGLMTLTVNSGGTGYPDGTNYLTLVDPGYRKNGALGGIVKCTASGGAITSIDSLVIPIVAGTAYGSRYVVGTGYTTTGGGNNDCVVNITAIWNGWGYTPLTNIAFRAVGNGTDPGVGNQTYLNYFYSSGNAPMSSWNFSTIWVTSGSLPYLKWEGNRMRKGAELVVK